MSSGRVRLDAQAATQDRIERVVAGGVNSVERVRATVAGQEIAASVILENGQYRLEVPARANNPKKLEQIRQPGLAGSSVTVECQRYSPLGANISWFRSGFLVLAAKCGYSLIRDKAFDVVRRQIIEDDTSLMPVWLSIAPAGFPEVQRGLWTVLSPDWHKGYVVQFNQRLIHFPKPGDLSFYERLGDPLRHREPTTCRFECVVDDATFGLSGDVP